MSTFPSAAEFDFHRNRLRTSTKRSLDPQSRNVLEGLCELSKTVAGGIRTLVAENMATVLIAGGETAKHLGELHAKSGGGTKEMLCASAIAAVGMGSIAVGGLFAGKKLLMDGEIPAGVDGINKILAGLSRFSNSTLSPKPPLTQAEIPLYTGNVRPLARPSIPGKIVTGERSPLAGAI